MGQQDPHERPVAAQHGRVQGGVAAPDGVRIGAALQQVRGERALTAEGREGEGRRPGRGRVLHVGAAVEQDSRRRDAAVPRREQQRREPAPVPHDALVVLRSVGALGVHHPRAHRRAGLDLRPVAHEDGGDVVVTLRHRPHQRGLAARPLGRVHVGPGGDEGPHAVRGAGPGRGHDRRLALRQRRVRVRAGREEPLDHRRAAVLGREPEGGRAELVGGVDGGPLREQQPRDGQIVAERGPVQGGGAVRLTLADVGASLQQTLDRAGVRGPRGGNQREPVGVGAGRGGGRDEQCAQSGEGAEPRHRAARGDVRAHRDSSWSPGSGRGHGHASRRTGPWQSPNHATAGAPVVEPPEPPPRLGGARPGRRGVVRGR